MSRDFLQKIKKNILFWIEKKRAIHFFRIALFHKIFFTSIWGLTHVFTVTR
jgi:hypothetical protein